MGKKNPGLILASDISVLREKGGDNVSAIPGRNKVFSQSLLV